MNDIKKYEVEDNKIKITFFIIDIVSIESLFNLKKIRIVMNIYKKSELLLYLHKKLMLTFYFNAFHICYSYVIYI